MRQPARPATNELIPNASSFVPAVPMATPAAARSFDRTASIRRPVVLRRTLATSSASTATTTVTNTPNTGRYGSVALRRPRFHPNSDGAGTLAPPVVTSPTKSGFLNTNSWMAIPPARVTMARFTPRTRNAGIPTSTPNTAATPAASRGAMGNGTPKRSASRERLNPPIPAMAIWASEIWPM